jgi:hypothetical protein
MSKINDNQPCDHQGMRLSDNSFRCNKTGARMIDRHCHCPEYLVIPKEDLTLELNEELGGQLEIF